MAPGFLTLVPIIKNTIPSSSEKKTGISIMVTGVAYSSELAKKITTLISASRTTVKMSFTFSFLFVFMINNLLF